MGYLMEIRKLTGKERFDANVISHVAFHMRMEDPEKIREWSEKQTVDDWGAFDEDGRLMAWDFDFVEYLKNHIIKTVGPGPRL